MGKIDVYRAMLLSMYLELGRVYLIGARDPLKYFGMVDYTIVSSIVHALEMVYYPPKDDVLSAQIRGGARKYAG